MTKYLYIVALIVSIAISYQLGFNRKMTQKRNC
jgi:hypothetical protein